MNLKKRECPNCGKKTLSYRQCKEWNAWKDRDKTYCRSCGSLFKVVRKLPIQENSLEGIRNAVEMEEKK